MAEKCCDTQCEEIRAWVAQCLEKYPHEPSALIMVLQEINRHFRYLPAAAMRLVAQTLGVPDSQVYAVATFYKIFSLTPRGQTIVKVCLGTACHIRGAGELVDAISRQLHIKPGQTTSDGKYTLETVNCVGACAMAPLMVVNEQYHGNVEAASVEQILKEGESGEV